MVLSVLWLVLRFQFGVSVEDVFREELSSRVEPRAGLITAQLRGNPRSEWDAILEKKSKEIGLQLSVLTVYGEWISEEGLSEKFIAEAEANFVINTPKSSSKSAKPNPVNEGCVRTNRKPKKTRANQAILNKARAARAAARSPEPRPSVLMQHKPPRITFSGADAQSSRWVGVLKSILVEICIDILQVRS